MSLTEVMMAIHCLMVAEMAWKMADWRADWRVESLVTSLAVMMVE